MQNLTLKVTDGDFLGALNNFFKGLLEKKIVDLLLVPQELPNKKCVVETLVKEPSSIISANPFAPVLMGNSAKLVSGLTFRPYEEKIGVVLRPCEIRALVELIKLKQVRREGLFIISTDCMGTYEVDEYEKLAAEKKNGRNVTEAFLEGAVKNAEPRMACRVCGYPRFHLYDMNIGFIGSDIKKEIRIKLSKEDLRLKELGLVSLDTEDKSDDVVKELKEKRLKKRDEMYKELKSRIGDNTLGLLDILSACRRCYNCQNACPICYCRECIFSSPSFIYELKDYVKGMNRKGSMKLPSDTLLFHLTRLNHMVVSCVACGQCTSACPSKIEIGNIFNMIGDKVQALFNYVPGRSFEEELPQSVFKEDELENVK